MENICKTDVTKRVKLNTQLDVIKFTQIASKCKGRVDCLEDNRNIDGKSILGVLSMNLDEPITVVFHDTYEESKLLKEIREWEVDVEYKSKM